MTEPKTRKKVYKNAREKKTSEASEKIRRRRKNGNKKYESASAKKMEVYKGVKTGTGKKHDFRDKVDLLIKDTLKKLDQVVRS